jgi:hypothetical protein
MGLAWELHQERRRRERGATAPTRPAITAAPVEPEPESVSVIVTAERYRREGFLHIRGQQIKVRPSELRGPDQRKFWLPQPSDRDWWTLEKRLLAAEPCDAVPHSSAVSPGALRIATACGYDPGNAVYRMHTAINERTKHASAFLIWRRADSNPFRCPQQIDALQQRALTRALIYEADVLYNNVDYFLRNAAIGNKPRRGQLVIRHYHGSVFPGHGIQHPIINAVVDDALGALLLGARLTLCALRPERMQWMPIPIPVDRYAAMVPAERRPGPFRIAHSATKEEYKGTRIFLEACDLLNKQGLAVEPVLIGYRRRGRGVEPAHLTHRRALEVKAGCDFTFDSFWLGIQGSGLEAAAMGQPVIAGDPDVAALYRGEFGEVPYIFADGGDRVAQRKALMDAIERLVLDDDYRAAESARVGRYVREYHDYPAVARRFEGILAKAFGREDVKTELPQLPPKRERDTVVRRVA